VPRVQTVVQQFFGLCLDLPLVPLFVLVRLAPWRSSLFWKHFNSAAVLSDCDRRMVVLQQFGLVLLDILCFPLSVFIFIGLWRVNPLLSAINHQLDALRADAEMYAEPASGDGKEKPPAKPAKLTFGAAFGNDSQIHQMIARAAFWGFIQLPLSAMPPRSGRRPTASSVRSTDAPSSRIAMSACISTARGSSTRATRLRICCRNSSCLLVLALSPSASGLFPPIPS